MPFPSFDTFRSSPSAAHSIHSQTKPTHFRPIPIDATTAGGKLIPERHSSLRVPPHHQYSVSSLARLDPPPSHTLSVPLTSSKVFRRPALPWGTQARPLQHSASESSFGADFVADDPPSPSQPSSSATTPPAQTPDFGELAPGDSSSNWSVNNLSRAASPAPPVPSIPAHLRAALGMPIQNSYPSEPESGYDSPDTATPNGQPFPSHLQAKAAAARSRRPVVTVTDDFDDFDEDDDHVPSLPSEAFGFGNNRSMNNVGGKAKADKMLGLDVNAKLCSLFMISGVGPTDAAKWVPADNVLAARMQPQPDSLGFFWRPELLGTAFSGPATEVFEKAMNKNKRMKKESWPLVMKPPAPGERGPFVPDAGPEGAEKLITQTIKYAHPKDVEVINTSLMPNTTSHYFSFSIPSHSTTAHAARARLHSIQAAENQSVTSLDQASTINAKQRQDLKKQAKITYYGATLTVWTCAEPERARQLADIRAQLKKKNELDAVLQAPITEPLEERTGTTKRSRIPPWIPYRNASYTDVDNSDTETVMSGGTETPRRARWTSFGADPLNLRDEANEANGRGVKGTMESSDIGIGPLKAGEGDTFWMPYSLTLVSRQPIFDTMMDYIRISWSMYQKSAKRNLYQMCKILNHPVPRPGEMFHLPIGRRADGDEITIETTFPGAVDFEKGMVKTDFQLWPLFQAVDIDGIITAIEIAMSRSGKVIFISQYAAMLCLAVHTLRYMVELGGWDGLSVPVLHARDVALAHDDPGPYILGLPMECRYMLATPVDACVIDLDTNTLTLKTAPPGVVTPRVRREKIKQKIHAIFGDLYPFERSVPTELKIAFPGSRFGPYHRIFHDNPAKPHFLAERMKPPNWWKGGEIMTLFNKIMADKHKKPTFMQRMKKTGLYRVDAPMTITEQETKDIMRRRAVHYIETRDELDVKVARINGKLMQLMQEGEKYKRQFQSFERQADQLADETLRLQTLYQKEHEEAERLLKLAAQQSQENTKLDGRLKATEEARATAMRQMSDMEESIQDLEREREAIMDIIEGQIAEAMESHDAEVKKLSGLPSGPDTPGSPTSQISSIAESTHRGLSSLSSRANLPPVSRGYRPGTTESAMSSTSKWTSRTDAISILGLARRGYSGGDGQAVINKRASVDTSHSGRDDVAARIAAIQAKLDMALHAAARNRTESFATVKPDMDPAVEEEAPEQAGGLGLDTHEENGEAGGEKTPTAIPNNTSPPTSVDDTSSNRSSTPNSVRTQSGPRPISRASSRPGSRLRIRRSGASSETSDASLSSAAQRLVLHGKSLTSSSSAASDSEMLVTPSNSGFVRSKPDLGAGKVSEVETDRRSSGGSAGSGGSLIKDDGRAEGKMAEMEDASDRRMSTISTTTVTFGPI